ncbi:hypothetical protein Bca101_013110 [Brassica carinata]
MDIDGCIDVHRLDPELLSLPGLSPSSFRVYSTFALAYVKSLIDDTSSSTPVSLSKNCVNLNISCGSALPSVFLNSGTPPLSPRSSFGSPRFSRQKD